MSKRLLKIGFTTCLIISFILSNMIFLTKEVNADTEQGDKKNYVLYLSSYSYSWETTPLQIKGVQKALSDKCVINYEFMDTKNATYSEDYKEFYDILKFKLSQRPAYDGVIVADDAALKFVQKYKDDLFLNTPIAFTGIDNIDNAELAKTDPYISGVTEKVDYVKNVEIAKKLVPDATKIVFINDKKENGIGIQKQLENSKKALEGFDVTYIISGDYTKEELEKKLRKIGDDTIVYMVSLGQGKNGVIYTEDERQDIISKNISVPVFRVSSANFPNIFIGGYVVDHEKCAYLAAMMIGRALDGNSMNSENIIEDTPSVYCFNEKLMKQYDISTSLLPKGTILKNQIPTFMSQHYILLISISAIISILLLTMVIFVIGSTLRNSRKANAVIEQKNKELEKALQAKSEFLSRMSHEMRTPLNSVLGCSHLAKVDYDKNLDISDDLDMIGNAGEYLLNIINDILDVSRIEAEKIQLNREWSNPNEVLRSAIYMMKPIIEQKNINFEFPNIDRKEVEKIEWYVDSKRVEQIIVNLLNNAAKFTPAGGTIKLEIKNVGHDASTSADMVVISDTGCGMSEEFISHIGEAFAQEQNEYSNNVTGTGLGLYIVKKIVEIMGGTLNVESELGKGSTFEFTVTYQYRVKKGQDILTSEAEVDISGMNVLYAEDNPMNQIVVKRLLENKSVSVTIASNGKEAVDTFIQSKPNEYDVILMDMRMPIMNGLDATTEIRQLERTDGMTIPIIALSADAISTEIEEANSKRLNAYLTKPIDPKKLYKTLADWRQWK